MPTIQQLVRKGREVLVEKSKSFIKMLFVTLQPKMYSFGLSTAN